jgi:hypothetical protein
VEGNNNNNNNHHNHFSQEITWEFPRAAHSPATKNKYRQQKSMNNFLGLA